MDYSMPGFPAHHQLPELTQTHVHRVGDAIQPSHPLSSPFSSCLQSFPASESFPRSQFFTSGGQSIGASASVLPMNIQDWFPLQWTGWISLQSKGLSRVFLFKDPYNEGCYNIMLNWLWGSRMCILKFDSSFISTFKRKCKSSAQKWENQLENAILITSQGCLNSFIWTAKLILVILEITQNI